MPRRQRKSAPMPLSNQYGSTAQPWDELKGELEDLLGQVQDQILEFEDDYAPEPVPHTGYQQRSDMSALTDMETRRQEALVNVRDAVERLGSKKTKSQKKKKKKRKNSENELDAAIAQIRASTQQFEEEQAAQYSAPSQPAYAAPQNYQSHNDHDYAEITGQIEGLHRSVRDLAHSVPNRDNFDRLEDKIHNLYAEVSAHQTPQADAIGDQLDGLQNALESLAGLQARQIEHLEELHSQKPVDTSGERQARIETSIRAIYDKFDSLEQSIDRPNSGIETIAKGIAGIAHAVGDMQKRDNANSSQQILAQVENVSQRLAAMDNAGSPEITSDIRQEIGRLRGQLVSALEPRFSALESRLDDMGVNSGSDNGSAAPAISQRLEAMEGRITKAISGINAAQARGGEGEASASTINALKAMEGRLNETLGQLRTTGTAVSSGASVSLNALEAMENRIADAIGRLENHLPTGGGEQYTGLKAIEGKLSESLNRLEALSGKPNNAKAKPVSQAKPVQPQPVAPKPAQAMAPSAPAKPVQARKEQVAAAPLSSTGQNTVSRSLSDIRTEKPSAPQSSFNMSDSELADKRRAGAQRMKLENAPASVEPQKPTSGASSRESFIAAARRATQERQPEPKSSSGGGLLGRALERIKSVNIGKNEKDSDAELEAVAAQEIIPQSEPVAEVPEIEELPEPTPEIASAKSTLVSKGPELAREHSATDTPKPRSAFELGEDADPDFDKLKDGNGESFLTKNRQPILLAASVVAIIAMTANLVLDRGNNNNELSNLTLPATADVGEAPRQISMTEVETAIAQQSFPEEVTDLAALTNGQGLADQNLGLVPPVPMTTDTLTTASVPATPAVIEMPPIQLGPEALRAAAAGGDPRAQFEIGLIYAEGKAVGKDSQAAVVWFERAAAAGYAPAQYRLGTAFEHGLGVSKDIEQSKLWYMRAAESGNRMGMHNLAALHAGGPDGARDFGAAARWFEEAAKRGVLDSQFNLGMLYARGLGVDQDFSQSYKWFSIAANFGDKDAAKARDDVARSLNPQQMTKVMQELATWQPTKIELASNFASIGTWSDQFDAGKEISKQDVVLSVQIALSKLGFSLGKPDGLIGPKTRDAIRTFERDLGMNETGAINPRLLTVLGSQPV